MILNTTKMYNYNIVKFNYEKESYCRILRLNSRKSDVFKQSGREFHSFEAIYEKE